MATPTNPTDIARETFKLLASRRVAPTPENYQAIYCEIAGTQPEACSVADILKVTETLSRKTPAMAQPLKALNSALNEGDPVKIGAALLALLPKACGEDDVSWGGLIRDLIRQWDLKQSGMTVSRKREGLERVLSNFSRDPSQLLLKLQALVSLWAENPAAQAGVPVDEDVAPVGAATPTSGGPIDVAGSADIADALREMLVQAIKTGVAPRLLNFPDLHDEALMLADQAMQANSQVGIQAVAKNIRQFWLKLELRNDSDAQVLDGLTRLLKMLTDNISELLLDDKWLHGQIAVVQDIIAKPLDSRVLYDAERSFKEVIFKQGNLKQSLNEAKLTIKSMVSSFISRMSEMSASTGEYHNKIERYAEEISQTEDIDKLNAILGGLMKDTRGMQLDMMRSRDELELAQKQVKEAESKIQQLETELDHASELVHKDHLTGVLNRRGMDEAFERELSRADRLKLPLCVSILDIDHFKRLNDTYGHEIGDEALVHLVKVVKDALRPSDVIARFGGEEFVIILPEASLDEASKVMMRVQRNLTKNFFMHGNQKLLITFSAGVALRTEGETPEFIIARADKALYQAKESGRNRVVAAV
ncbi:MAG: diguanylate cyclase [Sulfuricellaceae bacterium]|nr:diguanylate cyclase [Sulfuricellaceae bacterium]